MGCRNCYARNVNVQNNTKAVHARAAFSRNFSGDTFFGGPLCNLSLHTVYRIYAMSLALYVIRTTMLIIWHTGTIYKTVIHV